MKKILLVLLVALGLQTQAQVSPCDSIEYTVVPAPNSIVLQLNGAINGICPVTFPCVVSSWSWTVCDNMLCFSDTGQTVYFQQFATTDTLKVCLTTIIDYMGAVYSCVQCDSLVWDGFGGWIPLSMWNPVSVQELSFKTINDNKIYNTLGKELIEIPIGVMYIQNRKKYIKIK